MSLSDIHNVHLGTSTRYQPSCISGSIVVSRPRFHSTKFHFHTSLEFVHKRKCHSSYSWKTKKIMQVKARRKNIDTDYFSLKEPQNYTWSLLHIVTGKRCWSHQMDKTVWWIGVCNTIWTSITTPPQNHGMVIFSLQFVCVCVCLSVCVCVSVSEQNSNRTDASIWTRVSLNGCLLHWLKSYIEIGDLGPKVKVTVT